MASKLHLDQVQRKALQAKITGLIAKGAVVPACKSQVYLLTPLFVVPKSGGGWHPIIDLRKLNQYVKQPHFKMEGL